MLLLSFGISITHVYCDNNDQWVLGSEMPTCDEVIEADICPFSGKICNEPVRKEKDQRKKTTYNFEFEFTANNISVNEEKLVLSTKEFEVIPYTSAPISTLNIANNKNLLRAHSPPDISSIYLAKLQVFRI